MKSFGSICSEHWLGVCAALVMTLLVSAPLVAFPLYAGAHYKGINIFHFGSDEHIYITRAKEVLEGHGLGQPILKDHKDEQDPTFSYVERMLLSPFTLTGTASYVDPVTVYNIYDFLGVFALILIVYGFVYGLSGEKPMSIATAMFMVGGYSIVYNKALFFDDFNIYLRSNYPYMASVPFFLMCLFLYRAREKRSVKYALAAGLLFAFLFWDYFFGWTFALSFLGALFLAFLVTGEFSSLRYVVITGVTGLVLAIPVLYQYVSYFATDAGSQLSYFLLSTKGHKPVFSLIGATAGILLCVYWYLRRNDRAVPFIAALIIAGWVALNQQMLTGRYIQYGHYYWYFIVPSCIVVSLYMVGRLLPLKYRPYLAAGLVFIVLLNTCVGQYRSFFVTADEKMRDQDYAPFISKLQMLPKGSVLMENGGLAFPMLVTIYTNDDLHYGGSAQTYNVPISYMKDVLLLHLYLNKNARRQPVAYLREELDAKEANEYTNMYQDLEGYYSGTDYYTYHRELLAGTSTIAATREKLFAELGSRYATLFSKGTARDVLLASGTHYILVDRRLVPEWDLSLLGAKLIKKADDLELYNL